MKKQELIHMHGLLAEIAKSCEEDGRIEDLTDYAELETRPTSIHRAKGEHKEAVFALTEAILSAVDRGTVEPRGVRPASAD